MACSDFSAKRVTKRQSPIDVSSSALPKLPVSSSLVAVVPHTIIRSSRPQPGKFVFSDPKEFCNTIPSTADIVRPAPQVRLVPLSDSCTAAIIRFYSITSSAPARKAGGNCRLSARAAFKFTSISKPIGRATGSSEGLASFRIILSTGLFGCARVVHIYVGAVGHPLDGWHVGLV
jgi:hypothetical protein